MPHHPADRSPRIEAVSIGQLHQRIQDIAALSPAPPAGLPLSITRALAQQANPAAQPHQTALLLAWSGDQLAGYIGLLPARLHEQPLSPDTSPVAHPIAYLTGFYVHPAFRTSGAALALLRHAARLGVDLLVTGAAPASWPLYHALKWTPLPGPPITTWDLHRIHPLTWPRRRSPSARGTLIPRPALLPGLTRRISRRIIRQSLPPPPPDHAGWSPIDPHSLPDRCFALRPGTARLCFDRPWLAWILQHPWLRPASRPATAAGPATPTPPDPSCPPTPTSHFDLPVTRFQHVLHACHAGPDNLLAAALVALSSTRCPAPHTRLRLVWSWSQSPGHAMRILHHLLDLAALHYADHVELPGTPAQAGPPGTPCPPAPLSPLGLGLTRLVVRHRSDTTFLKPAHANSPLQRLAASLSPVYGEGDVGPLA